jgi:hypothetical protein
LFPFQSALPGIQPEQHQPESLENGGHQQLTDFLHGQGEHVDSDGRDSGLPRQCFAGSCGGDLHSRDLKLASLGIPTTTTLSVGKSYTVFIEGVYTDSKGNPSAEYWQAMDVAASGE